MARSAKPKLVPMREKHLNATFKWLQNSSLRSRIDCLEAPTKARHEAYWNQKWSDKSRRDFAILNKGLGHIGNCGLRDIDLKRGKAELWIYLGGDYRRRIGSYAVRELLAKAFKEMRLNRVYVRVLATNAPAEKFFRSLGFAHEGCWRNDTRRDGRYVDSQWFSILAKEYDFR